MNVTFHRWLNSKTKKTYIFNPNDSKFIPIFADDTIEKATTKITLLLASLEEYETDIKHIPYIWTDKTQLRTKFNIIFPLNPWKYKKTNYSNVATTYNDTEIFDQKEINILFYNDATDEIKNAPFYFPDKLVEWKMNGTLDNLRIEANKLYYLWKLSENIEINNIMKNDVIYTKVNFNNDPSKMKINNTLDSIFERTKTTEVIPFMQYCKDISKIKYKLNKNHKIPSYLLQQWTLYEKTSKIPMVIFMIQLKKTDTYARCCITESFAVYIQYNIESKDKIEWQQLNDHSIFCKNFLQQILKQPITITCDTLSLRVDIPDQNISYNGLSKNITLLQPLYHLIKSSENLLLVAFKRTNKYQKKTDISEHIKNGIKHGIPLNDIILSLEEYGVSKDDINYWIEAVQNEDEDIETKPKKSRSLLNTGCVLKISKVTSAFRINIENVATREEIARILRWLYSTLRTKLTEKKIIKVVKPVSSSSSSEGVETEEAEEKSEEELFEGVNFSDAESSGGAIGKESQRYFIDMLKKADPKIFQDNSDYPKKCGVAQLRQPVVISKEEKQYLEKNGYTNWDSILEYGSEGKHNFYFCPKIWCPGSKIPLSEKQLKENNGKCPKNEKNNFQDELPIILYNNTNDANKDGYWGKYDKAHNIGFHSNKGTNGLCLPCCIKKQLTQRDKDRCNIKDEANKSEESKNSKSKPGKKENTPVKESYIMGALAPIPEGRYGSIPKQLHNILMPNTGYHICNNISLSSEECMLRKGIKHSSDSLLEAVAILLKLPDKKALIKLIKTKLNPLKYLALENGHLYQVFAEELPLVPEDNKKLVSESNKWNDGIFNELSSRNLNIYKSYLNFIEYLYSNEQKNIHHIIAILEILGYILIVVEKYGNNDITFQCSAYSRGIGNNVIFLFHEPEPNLYEPLELKKRNKPGETIFNLKKYPYITKILNKCNKNRKYNFIDTLDIIKSWTDEVLTNGNNFEAQTIIIRQDLQIFGVLTKKNILLLVPNGMYGIEELLAINVATKYKFAFLEDIESQIYKIKVLRSDLELFRKRIGNIGFGLNIGDEIEGSNNKQFYTGELRIPDINLAIPPKIIETSNDEFKDFINNSNKTSNKWFQVQNEVGKELLMHYETLVQPLFGKSRTEVIKTLMKTFPKLDKSLLQTTLEEMPLNEGKEAISKWIRLIGIEKNAQTYYNDRLIDNGNEWVFSQTKVDNGIPKQIIYPKLNIIQNDVIEDYSIKEKELEEIPLMLRYVQQITLPTKFGKLSNVYKINITDKYEKDSLSKFLEWLSIKMNRPIKWIDVESGVYGNIIKSLEIEETGVEIFKQDSIMSAFSLYYQKTYKSPEMLWEKKLNKLTHDERVQVFTEILKENLLWPSDFEIYNIAKLLNINILMIHRAESGITKGEIIKRGDINDRIISSSFIKASNDWKSQVLLILYKNKSEDDHNVYNVISTNGIDGNLIFLFELDSLPIEFLNLIKEHIKLLKER